MARKDTFKEDRNTVVDNLLNDDISDTNSFKNNLHVDEDEKDSDEPKKNDITIEETNDSSSIEEVNVVETDSEIAANELKSNNAHIDLSKSLDNKTVTKTIRIPEYIDEAIRDITYQSNGKKVPGSRGFIKTLATNGIIRELVEIGYFDEKALDLLDRYDFE